MILQEFLDKEYTKEQQRGLTELDCHTNQLTSLEGIENLTNLDCENNKLPSDYPEEIEDIIKYEYVRMIKNKFNL